MIKQKNLIGISRPFWLVDGQAENYRASVNRKK